MKMLFLTLLILVVVCGKPYGILCGEQGSRGQINKADLPDLRGQKGQFDPYINKIGGVKKQGSKAPLKRGLLTTPGFEPHPLRTSENESEELRCNSSAR